MGICICTQFLLYLALIMWKILNAKGKNGFGFEGSSRLKASLYNTQKEKDKTSIWCFPGSARACHVPKLWNLAADLQACLLPQTKIWVSFFRIEGQERATHAPHNHLIHYQRGFSNNNILNYGLYGALLWNTKPIFLLNLIQD